MLKGWRVHVMRATAVASWCFNKREGIVEVNLRLLAGMVSDSTLPQHGFSAPCVSALCVMRR